MPGESEPVQKLPTPLEANHRSGNAASRTAFSAVDLVADLGGELVGAADIILHRIGPLLGADAQTLSFLAHPKYRQQLEATQAGCVIVAPELAAQAGARAVIVTPNPYLYFARATQWWARRLRPAKSPGVHPTAFIAPGAVVAASALVHAFACVDEDAEIGPGAEIGPHAHVGQGAKVGEGTRLGSHVSLGFGCSIGRFGLIHPGVVIGADGFGFAPTGGQDSRWEKIEQLGGVRIGDHVEIGANSCIDRGALEDTVIEDGVKLDNLIQIGHNVHIGAHTAMAGCAGVAGSARIGAHCTIGGGAIVLGHLTLADHVHISAASVVMRSILKPGQYSGVFPIDDNESWEKNAATLRHLHGLRARLMAVEKKLS
jgi:UDP-3-O-[3-hydroxymyristoyl] glucosamine N-acyltransferase